MVGLRKCTSRSLEVAGIVTSHSQPTRSIIAAEIATGNEIAQLFRFHFLHCVKVERHVIEGVETGGCVVLNMSFLVFLLQSKA